MKDLLTKILTGFLGSILRHALTTVGGVGLVQGSTGEQINPDTLAAGLAAILVGLGWSYWEKSQRKSVAPQTETTNPK